MASIQTIQTIQTTKPFALFALKQPPQFPPRYDKRSVDFYLNKLIKPQVIKHLMTKVGDPNSIDYEQLGVNEIEDSRTRNMVKTDLKTILVDSLRQTFYKPCSEELFSPNYDISEEDDFCINHKYIIDVPYDEKTQRLLEDEMCRQINELVYKRTVYKCTRRWGYI